MNEMAERAASPLWARRGEICCGDGMKPANPFSAPVAAEVGRLAQELFETSATDVVSGSNEIKNQIKKYSA